MAVLRFSKFCSVKFVRFQCKFWNCLNWISSTGGSFLKTSVLTDCLIFVSLLESHLKKVKMGKMHSHQIVGHIAMIIAALNTNVLTHFQMSTVPLTSLIYPYALKVTFETKHMNWFFYNASVSKGTQTNKQIYSNIT